LAATELPCLKPLIPLFLKNKPALLVQTGVELEYARAPFISEGLAVPEPVGVNWGSM
jgi:hypothetical protein